MPLPNVTFNKNTIFVSCSSDMSSEVEVVFQVIDELNRRLPEGDRFNGYHWSKSDTVWTANGTWQEYIPRTSDDNVSVVICLLGERLGVPLPDYFPFSPEEFKLPEWVRFPWTEREPENMVPLTGTLFELLDAYQKQARFYQNRPIILIYVKIDNNLFTQINLAPDQRKYGFENYYRQLCGKDVRITDRVVRQAYDTQLDWLDCFCGHFLRLGGRPHICYGNADGGNDSCLVDLKTRLRKDLSRVLNLPAQGSQARLLKNLEAYQPDDHDILFGRDQTIFHLLERLNALSTNGTSLLVLSGRSGEGKSSVLRAGLIGRLGRGRYPDFGIFNTVLVDAFTLGIKDPLANLEKAINDALGGTLWCSPGSFDSIRPELRKIELVAAVKRALANIPSNNAIQKRRLFIGIDQFEELLVAAEEDAILRSSVAELVSTVRLMAENGMAWIVIVLSSEHLDRMAQYEPNLKLETEILGRPGDADLRNIITKSFEAANVPITEMEISLIMSGITAWLSRQEDPGPILPLVSVLMKEISDDSKKKAKPITSIEDYNSKINKVINELCDRAWENAYRGWKQQEDNEAAFNRLMRQLVVTGLREGGELKLLRQCPYNHDAVIKAKPLVDQMKKNRLLLQPVPNVLRLAHISIIENWQRAQTWYDQERKYHLFIAELELMYQKYKRDKELGKPGRLLADAQEIDDIEALWLSWIDDEDRLPIPYLRKCLTSYFEPHHRPDSWKRLDGASRLNYAVSINDEALLEDYLNKIELLGEKEKIEIINYTGETFGNTALHLAMPSGNISNVKKLLELGAELNKTNKDGCTPLWLASKNGQAEICTLLIESGADINISDIKGSTPLPIAFYSLLSQLDVMDMPDEKDGDTDIATNRATKVKYLKIIRRLRELGTVLNDTNCRQLREVYEKALNNKHTEILDLLIESGFSLDFTFDTGETPLIKAVSDTERKVNEMSEILLRYGIELKGLPSISSKKNTEEIVKILLDAGATPDLENNEGMSAIHYAAQIGNLQIISTLVEKGESLDHVGAFGMTPLVAAVSSGQYVTVQYLLKLGVDPNLRTENRQIPIIKAAQKGNAQMIKLLCSYGAQTDVKDQRNMTALMYAAWYGYTDAIKALLEFKANKEITGPDEMTVEMIAEHGCGMSRDEREEVLKILKTNKIGEVYV